MRQTILLRDLYVHTPTSNLYLKFTFKTSTISKTQNQSSPQKKFMQIVITRIP